MEIKIVLGMAADLINDFNLNGHYYSYPQYVYLLYILYDVVVRTYNHGLLISGS